MTKYTNDNTSYAAYRVFETLKFLINQPASVEDITDGIVTTNTTASITITASSSIKVNPFLFNFFIFYLPPI